jgi:hypothetical protein
MIPLRFARRVVESAVRVILILAACCRRHAASALRRAENTRWQATAGDGRVYTGAVPQDLERTRYVSAALKSWKVPYRLALESGAAAAAPSAPALSAGEQQTLAECAVPVRICTAAAQQSPHWQSEAEAFRALQATDRQRAGSTGRKMIDLVFGPGNAPAAADVAHVRITASAAMGAPWVIALRRELRDLKPRFELSRPMLTLVVFASLVTLIAICAICIVLVDLYAKGDLQLAPPSRGAVGYWRGWRLGASSCALCERGILP